MNATKRVILAMMLAVASVAHCETGETIAISAKVTLADGSQLNGTPRVSSLALTTGFGKQEIPLAQIAALDFVKDGMKVRFHNRDVLSGKVEGTPFEIKTVFKEVRLDWAQIKSIQFSKQRSTSKNADEQGLLLHALLDVDNEDLSRFGASLEAHNVLIVEGKNGNAMLLNSPNAKAAINVPFSPFLLPEGTVEFWAKLPQPNQHFDNGGQVFFLNFRCPELNYIHHFIFGFASNSGTGGGGLFGRIHGISIATTHSTGAVSSAAETGVLGDTPDGWHHYSIVWKKDGFEFPEANGKIFLLTVDGKIVATGDSFHYRNVVDTRETEGKKIRLVLQDHSHHFSDFTCPVAMSDLKVWDHAKFPIEID